MSRKKIVDHDKQTAYMQTTATMQVQQNKWPTARGREIVVNKRELPPRNDLGNHNAYNYYGDHQ